MTNQQTADITFSALTLWREARGESTLTKTAVMFSILNRVYRPCWWGTDVMSVVFKKWQYSSLTAPTDPQLTTWPKSSDSTWQECLEIARGVICGDTTFVNPVPGADSYFDDSIQAPNWTNKARFVRKLGRLSFYDVDFDYEQNGER
jgi:spore germination cell wall hydrolase CwlJ-like protein